MLTDWAVPVAALSIVEFTSIVPSFVISLLIFTYAPKESLTSVTLIVPLFTAFPFLRLTPFVTLLSAINAIPAELSALSFAPASGFFLNSIVPEVLFIIVAVSSDFAANFIP